MNASKCVEIAKDVLSHLRSLQIKSGVYMDGALKEDIAAKTINLDAHKCLNTISKNCKVCALGACFLSHIRKFDNVAMKDIMYSHGLGFRSDFKVVTAQLKEYFHPADMYLIEVAFERMLVHTKEEFAAAGVNPDDALAAVAFGMSIKNTKQRLKAIMHLVLAGQGRFRIPAMYYEDRQQARANRRIAKESQLEFMPFSVAEMMQRLNDVRAKCDTAESNADVSRREANTWKYELDILKSRIRNVIGV